MGEVRDRWRACVTPGATAFGVSAADLGRDRFVSRLLEAVADRAERARTSSRGSVSLADVQALERRVAVSLAFCEAVFATARARIAAPHEAALVARRHAELRRIAAAIRSTEARYPRFP